VPLADRLVGAGVRVRRAECISIKVSAWHVKFRVFEVVAGSVSRVTVRMVLLVAPGYR
jgi:hypothetical protein